ncbi:hypothetical protein [Leptospira kmetyi]|uniref:Lipoprotein n=1 Tax=Leptospira kmetyi TaxID=408139 RepID=A0ABX4N6I9_9LEPT|nr:hypothetical protein [Leptospira kmetyi]PJZ27717.1 hypothetical protein CH378_21595 [Leptospira kmetyi]
MKSILMILLICQALIFTECSSSYNVREIKEKADLDLEGQFFAIGKGGYGNFELVGSYSKFEKSKDSKDLLSFTIIEEGKIFGLHSIIRGRENSSSSICYISNVKVMNIGYEIELLTECSFNGNDEVIPYTLHIRKGAESMKSSYHKKFQNINDIILIDGVGGWPSYITRNPNQAFHDKGVIISDFFNFSTYSKGTIFNLSENGKLGILLDAHLADKKLELQVLNKLNVSGNEFEINEKIIKYEAIRKKEFIYLENNGLTLGKYDFIKQGYNLAIKLDDSVGGYFGRAPFEYSGIYSDTMFLPIEESEAKKLNLEDYTYAGVFKQKLSIEKEKYIHCNSKGQTIITSKEFMEMASAVDPTIVCKEKIGSFAKVKLQVVKFKLLNKGKEIVLEIGK